MTLLCYDPVFLEHDTGDSQATFWEDSRVGYLSIHRWPFYPFTGAADETGSGKGLGTTHNLPVTFGTPRAAYLSRFTTELERFAADIKPQLVMVSAGFDSHRDDPIGSLGLESEDFGPMTRAVLDVADSYADGRVVSVLGRGLPSRRVDRMRGNPSKHLTGRVKRTVETKRD